MCVCVYELVLKTVSDKEADGEVISWMKRRGGDHADEWHLLPGIGRKFSEKVIIEHQMKGPCLSTF